MGDEGGYHVHFTRARSPVRARAESFKTVFWNQISVYNFHLSFGTDLQPFNEIVHYSFEITLLYLYMAGFYGNILEFTSKKNSS